MKKERSLPAVAGQQSPLMRPAPKPFSSGRGSRQKFSARSPPLDGLIVCPLPRPKSTHGATSKIYLKRNLVARGLRFSRVGAMAAIHCEKVSAFISCSSSHKIFKSGSTHTQDTEPRHRTDTHTRTEKNQHQTTKDQTVNTPGHKSSHQAHHGTTTSSPPPTLRTHPPAPNRGAWRVHTPGAMCV